MIKIKTIEGISVSERVFPSREELLSKYKERNSNRIAEEYGVTGRTIRNWLEKHGIARRVQTPSKEELSLKCETKTDPKTIVTTDIRANTIRSSIRVNAFLDANFFLYAIWGL